MKLQRNFCFESKGKLAAIKPVQRPALDCWSCGDAEGAEQDLSSWALLGQG